MPLIGMLSANKNMVVCGVDRVVGKEGKPVLFIAELGFGERFGKFSGVDHTLLAPAVISESLPTKIRRDLQKIANRFERKNKKEIQVARDSEATWWALEFEAMHEEDRKRQMKKELKEIEEEKRKKEEIWEG